MVDSGLRSLRNAGIVLGIGLGGFIDGIVFHQILQWHHMLTSAGFPPDSVRNLQMNTLAHGLFHAFTWVMTALGVYMLWRAIRDRELPFSGKLLIGGILAGFGLFNFVEGLVNHYILGIHHVRTGPDQAIYDLAFLISGVVLAVVGWMLTRQGERETLPRV